MLVVVRLCGVWARTRGRSGVSMTRDACLPRRPQSQHLPPLADARRVWVAGSMAGVEGTVGFVGEVG